MEDDPKPNPEPSQPAPNDSPQSGLGGLWSELKRRHVVRVAIVYAVVAWLIIQVASTTFGSFGIPEWAFRFVVIMLCAFFPVAIIVAWAFELTPQGIKTSKTALAEQGDVPLSEKEQKKRNWFSLALAAAVPTLIFGALATFFYFRSDSVEPTTGGKSIAVLPFTNMSPDGENAYFADGIHETILTTLANLGDLRVTSRTSVMPYRDSNKPIPTIGEELNVAHILEGSVQRIGDQFRLTAQLIKSGTDEHLWAENYDGEFKDVFAVQSQLAREISQSLKAVLSPEEKQRLNKNPAEDLQAYELYLRALSLGDSSSESIALLEQATSIDPQFTLAWVRLSAMHSNRFQYMVDRTAETKRRAREAINRALEIDRENPRVALEFGHFFYVFDRDYELAEYFYRQVQKKLPNDWLVHLYLGSSHKRQGREKEAIEYFETAYILEPSYGMSLELTHAYLRGHDWDKTVDQLQATLRFIEDSSKRKFIELWAAFYKEDLETQLDGLQDDDKAHYFWAIGDSDSVIEYTSAEGREHPFIQDDIHTLISRRSPSWYYSIANLVSGNKAEGQQVLLDSINKLNLILSGTERDFYSMRLLGLYQAAIGDEKGSLNTFKQVTELLSEQPDIQEMVNVAIDRSIALAWLGHEDKAVQELDRLIRIPSKLNVRVMRHCLDFWPLRNHPGFQAILDNPANNQPLDLDNL